ncbi:MAG: 6,7-dimethyl-8-ribityllumazine synthase [Leptospiraceae bacterium]|nr:6,7-dimethyl-8-ribityllumazine synthase [Leptospiraceae bacterium]
MSQVKIHTSSLAETRGKIAILAAEFNSVVVDNLMKGALDTLQSMGVKSENISVYKVPGAFELPLVAKTVLQKSEIEGVIALGCVIRGDTLHFELVAGQCASGLMSAGLETGKPAIFGVLTTDTVEQAMNRAGLKAGNKGSEAAMVLLQTLSILSKVKSE